VFLLVIKTIKENGCQLLLTICAYFVSLSFGNGHDVRDGVCDKERGVRYNIKSK
jgi:hypothetical protein